MPELFNPEQRGMFKLVTACLCFLRELEAKLFLPAPSIIEAIRQLCRRARQQWGHGEGCWFRAAWIHSRINIFPAWVRVTGVLNLILVEKAIIFCGVRRAANSHLLDPFAPRWWNNLLKKLFTTPKRLTGERESIFRCIQPRTALNYIAWILYKVCWYYDSRLPGTYLQTIILLDLMNFNVTYFPHDGIVTHRY